ncbi:MAG: DUF402 domain-containing protein [Lachnospiraceae bacterium]|nr:DUF402 domain-containing protein [Lachnospiraceae bacterium]
MDIENLHLYRRRFIPDETIALTKDNILKLEDNLLITSWKTLNPKQEFACGVSAFFLDKGWKVSKIMDCEGNLKYWYCDIIDCIIDDETNSFTYEDLLFDVVVSPTGSLKVLDCDEAAEAREKGLITEEQLLRGLRSMNELLYTIYHGRFDRLQAVIENAIVENKP